LPDIFGQKDNKPKASAMFGGFDDFNFDDP